MFNLLEAVNIKGSDVWLILFQLFLLKGEKIQQYYVLCINVYSLWIRGLHFSHCSWYIFVLFPIAYTVQEHSDVYIKKKKKRVLLLRWRKDFGIMFTNEMRNFPEGLSEMRCYHYNLVITSRRCYSKISVNKTYCKYLPSQNYFIIKTPIFLMKNTPFSLSDFSVNNISLKNVQKNSVYRVGQELVLLFYWPSVLQKRLWSPWLGINVCSSTPPSL